MDKTKWEELEKAYKEKNPKTVARTPAVHLVYVRGKSAGETAADLMRTRKRVYGWLERYDAPIHRVAASTAEGLGCNVIGNGSAVGDRAKRRETFRGKTGWISGRCPGAEKPTRIQVAAYAGCHGTRTRMWHGTGGLSP